MSARRDEMIAIAKTHAGYGLLDSPCRPSRSAYVDGSGGDDLFTMAEHRWWRYRSELMSNTTEDLLELRQTDWEVLGVCPVCQLADENHKLGCPRRATTFPTIVVEQLRVGDFPAAYGGGKQAVWSPVTEASAADGLLYRVLVNDKVVWQS